MSGLIASALRIDTILPVLFLFAAITVYFPIPVFYGVIQGLKRFYVLGLVQIVWGGGRCLLAAMVVFLLHGGLNLFFVSIILAILFTGAAAWYNAREVFTAERELLPAGELSRAFSLVLPVVITFFVVTVMKNADLVYVKRLFGPAEVDAYACAALVGSGFFTVSGIFMVMFPLVSEETALGGNPVVFLLKSAGAIIAFSSAGIVAAWLFPGLIMRIITLGADIPGAEPLIRYIGFAVTPVSLVFMMSNYLLARHRWGFVWIPVAGAILQVAAMVLHHPSTLGLLSAVTAANTVTFIMMTVYVVYEHSRHSAVPSTHDQEALS